jgi:pimeloyl-ACP methyl ester carboxylesterase
MLIASFIDRIEERAARQDEAHKRIEPVAVGAALAFPGVEDDAPLGTLASLVADRMPISAEFFSATSIGDGDFGFDGHVLRFRSPILTETAANNVVYATVREVEGCSSAVVILPHWNAAMGSYRKLSRILAALGMTTVEMTLPYHGLRNRPGAAIADHFVSPNLGGTIRATRQAVLDTRTTMDWLARRGYRRFALIGVSMGSCVAGLVAAHDTRVTASALLLAAGDFAEVVWTSRATRHIKESLATGLTLDQLKSVWSIISAGTFARALSREDHTILVLSGARDRVAKPLLTERLCAQLQHCGARFHWRSLSCGHYSMGIFPFNAMTVLLLWQFLTAQNALRPERAAWLPLSMPRRN